VRIGAPCRGCSRLGRQVWSTPERLPASTRDDAAFLEAEVATSARSRSTNDDVIDQVELEDTACFINPAREAQVGL